MPMLTRFTGEQSRRIDDAAHRAPHSGVRRSAASLLLSAPAYLADREGIVTNHKPLRRLYRGACGQEAWWTQASTGVRAPTAMPVAPNHRWSIDFVSDSFTDGRRFRVLTVVRPHARVRGWLRTRRSRAPPLGAHRELAPTKHPLNCDRPATATVIALTSGARPGAAASSLS
jgi:hypothetical protein